MDPVTAATVRATGQLAGKFAALAATSALRNYSSNRAEIRWQSKDAAENAINLLETVRRHLINWPDKSRLAGTPFPGRDRSEYGDLLRELEHQVGLISDEDTRTHLETICGYLRYAAFFGKIGDQIFFDGPKLCGHGQDVLRRYLRGDEPPELDPSLVYFNHLMVEFLRNFSRSAEGLITEESTQLYNQLYGAPPIRAIKDRMRATPRWCRWMWSPVLWVVRNWLRLRAKLT